MLAIRLHSLCSPLRGPAALSAGQINVPKKNAFKRNQVAKLTVEMNNTKGLGKNNNNNDNNNMKISKTRIEINDLEEIRSRRNLLC